MRLRRLLVAALPLAAVGCALQPPPAKEETRQQALPNLAVPERWQAVPAEQVLGQGQEQVQEQAEVAAGWLATFHDPRLEALVREALEANPDLRIAAGRVEQASGYARLAGAAIYPQVSLLARGGTKLSTDSSGLNAVGIFASWEIDLWGRVRAGREASAAQYDSAVLDAEYARQSISALVAKSWFLATEARLQKGLAEEMGASSERLVSLAQDRMRIGNGSELDVVLARAGLQTYRDAAQQLELAYRQALRALETLAGRYPGAAIEVPAQLAMKPGPVPVGMPSQLLERRPDVVAAERRVAAAFYLVEQANAARLPTISLTTSLAAISSDLLVLKNHDNPVWSLGAGVLFPLFTGGALKSQAEIRTSEQKLAVAEYGRVGARAFGEVEGALSSEFALDAREALLRQAVAENERALELENVRYRVGSVDLRAVQQQQLALYASRTTLLRVRSEQLVQRVNLHLALGGGWAEGN